VAAVKVLEAPLDVLSESASFYPSFVLRHGDTGLCLFAAAFLGINDAIHMARQEMSVTCVDINKERLMEMSALYEKCEWSWHVDDAWEFAGAMRAEGAEWDVVSVDTFTGNATDRALQDLDLWCSLARRAVTATVCPGSEYVVPAGWESGVLERSEIASWLVLTR
jgi:hypothetical protein